MDLRTLYNIQNLKFDSPFQCKMGSFILTNQYAVREEFYTEGFIERFGKISVEKNKDLVFAYSAHLVTEEQQGDFSPTGVMFSQLNQISSLMTFLWMVKDNAAFVTDANSVYSAPTPLYRYLSFGTHAWNQGGKNDVVSFSQTEIKEAADLAVKYLAIQQNSPTSFSEYGIEEGETQVTFGMSPEYKHNDNHSIGRALMFLAGARQLSHIPYRIAMYIPIFECLFSTDTQESTQKVCERVAFYLRESGKERMKLFYDLKLAYDFRSKFLHGAKFDPRKLRDGEPERIAILMDNIAREVFKKVILHDSDMFIEIVGKGRGEEEEQRKKKLNDIIFA